MSRLDEIRKRTEAATEGPWNPYVNTVVAGNPKGQDVRARHYPSERVCRDCTVVDMDFIANARQDIPYLLGLVERLKVCLENWKNNAIIEAGYLSPMVEAETDRLLAELEGSDE